MLGQPKYKIVRRFADGRPNKIIKIGLGLEEAKTYCKNPANAVSGKWFGGYTKQ